MLRIKKINPRWTNDKQNVIGRDILVKENLQVDFYWWIKTGNLDLYSWMHETQESIKKWNENINKQYQLTGRLVDYIARISD